MGVAGRRRKAVEIYGSEWKKLQGVGRTGK